jgi:hypothetical protein
VPELRKLRPARRAACRERRAEPVLEKAAGNFCEFFYFVLRNWTLKNELNQREAVAREQLKKLFGD